MTSEKENPFTLPSLAFKEVKSKLHSNGKSAKIAEHLDKYDPLTYCRTCANTDPCLVPIFKEEGLNYNLNKKIEKYLPIRVSQEDDLPVHLCYHCASTLIAWDTLILGCVEAEKKLNLLKNFFGNKQCEGAVDVDERVANKNIDSDDEPLISKKTSNSIKEKKLYGTRKCEEQRDILQEKNDFQTSLEGIVLESERLINEPDLSFSTYQCQFNMRKPFILDILRLGIGNSFCCENCTAVEKIKSVLVKSFNNLTNDNAKTHFKTKFKSGKRQKQLKSDSEFLCKTCGKLLPSKLSLRNHTRTHHSPGKGFSCNVCGKLFRHRFNLSRHTKVIHEGARNHVCLDCGKRFRSRGEMEDHRNVHDPKRKYICEECGKIFLTRASFYPHKKSHRLPKVKKANAEFDCGECRKKFTTKKSRDQHVLIHTGEKPIVCAVCGKNFRTKANFSQHAKVHSDLRPFGCEHCGKAFARRDHLTIHVRSHTGEKPFVCHLCGKGFAQMNDMKKHSRVHEKK